VALLVSLATVGAIGQAAPTFSIDDVSVNEGLSGVTMVEFTVSLADPNGTESSVAVFTNNGTAVGGGLRKSVPSAGPITLADGPSSPYGIPFNVSGVTGPLVSLSLLFENLRHPSPPDVDVLLEAPSGESMVVQSDAGPATNPNTISYILADYNPQIGNSFLGGSYGPTSRSPADVFPAPAPAGPYGEAAPAGSATMTDWFRFATPNGTWRAYINDDSPGGTGTLNRIVLFVDTPEPGTDFSHVGGRLTFTPGGPTTQKVRVWVNGDTVPEGDETFVLDLAVPVNGVVGDSQGIGTIRDGGGSGGLPPTTQNDAYQTTRDTPLRVSAPGVLSNDMSNLGGPMTAQIVTQPTFGLLTPASDGSFDYIPGPGFTGTDTFTYRAVNGAGPGNIAAVTITVAPPPAPTAVDDRYVDLGAGVIQRDAAGGVLSNDLANGGGPMTAVLVQGPAQGTLTLNPNGSFTYLAPGPLFSERFTYRVTNANGTSNVATVTLLDQITDGPYGPTNAQVDEIYGDSATRRVRIRFDPPAQGPAPEQYALTGGVLPGQTLAQILTGSASPIYEFAAPPSGSYYIRVHAVTGNVLSAPSNEVPLHVTTAVPPSPPANLQASVSGADVTLAWENTFDGGYPEFAFLDVSGGANVRLTLPVIEAFSAIEVPFGVYDLEIRLANTTGPSLPSNKVTVTIPSTCSGPPAVPQNFLLYTSGSTLGATWDLPATGPAPTGYALNVTSAIFTGNLPIAQRSISGTVPPGTYTASVAATGQCGSSAATPGQTVVVQ
jgi:hypothetical protein